MAAEISWSCTEIFGTFVGSGILLLVVAKLVCRFFFAEKPTEYPKGVVIFCQVPKTPVAPNLCPFAVKLGTYMRMANIPYQNVYSMKLSPKRKTPWIIYNGQAYSDSQFIIEFLNKEFNVDLSKHLTAKEKAIAHSMRKMTEESLYWTFIMNRWVQSYGDPTISRLATLSGLDLWKLKMATSVMSYFQGYGRHTEEEVERISRQDLQALNDHIGDKPYLMGDKPCEEDCAVFGMIAMMWLMRDSSFITKMVKGKTFGASIA